MSYIHDDLSFDYDETSSLDSGIERSYEINEIALKFKPKKLCFDGFDEAKTIKKRQYRHSKVTIEEFKQLEKEFQPCLGTQTSTPVKAKRKYAQGKSRISRSQSPTQIVKIRKFRRVKANDRERNRMHSLNEALGKILLTLFPRELGFHISTKIELKSLNIKI